MEEKTKNRAEFQKQLKDLNEKLSKQDDKISDAQREIEVVKAILSDARHRLKRIKNRNTPNDSTNWTTKMTTSICIHNVSFSKTNQNQQNELCHEQRCLKFRSMRAQE